MSRRAIARGSVLLGVLAAALYAPTLGFRFNDFDDRVLIVESQQVLRDPSFLPKAFVEDAFHDPEAKFYYRPLLTVSFMADASWGGAEPFAYRLTNLLLHVLAVILAWRLLRTCGAPRGASLLAAAVFAVHPALAQAVAWVPGRNDTLLAVWVFASFAAFVRWLETRRRGQAVLHVALWAAALLTKETAVVVPVLAVAWAGLRGGRRRLARGDGGFVGAWIVVGVVWAVARHLVLANPWSPSAADTLRAVAAAIPTGVAAFGFLVAPFGLSVYPRADAAHLVVGALAFAAIAAGAWRAPHGRRPLAAFGVAWLVLFLLPSLGRIYLVDPGEFLVHRLYVPAFGALLALAAMAPDGLASRARKPLAVACVVGVAALAAATVVFLPSFRDPVSFWENAVAHGPRSAFAQGNLGAAYFREERWADAAAAWERSLALDPDSEETRHDLSMAYRRRGLSEETAAALDAEIARNPRNAAALYWSGVSHDFAGRYGEAVKRWEAAIAADPGFAEAWAALVRDALASGDLVRAARYAADAVSHEVTLPEDLRTRLREAGAAGSGP